MGFDRQLVSGFGWANGFGLFLPPLTTTTTFLPLTAIVIRNFQYNHTVENYFFSLTTKQWRANHFMLKQMKPKLDTCDVEKEEEETYQAIFRKFKIQICFVKVVAI